MAHWKHPEQSEYFRLREDYDAAFSRLRAAAWHLCTVLESGADAETKSAAQRRMEEALADYRASRDRLAYHLASAKSPAEAIRRQRQPSQEEVRQLAYRLWEQAGRPTGSADQDWQRAEELLRS
jgi:hypothetical protein